MEVLRAPRQQQRLQCASNGASTSASRSLDEAKAELFHECEKAGKIPSRSDRALDVIEELRTEHNETTTDFPESARRIMCDGHFKQLYSDTAATVDGQYYPLQVLTFGTLQSSIENTSAKIDRVEQYVGPNGFDDRHSGYDIVQYITLNDGCEGKLIVGADYEFDSSPDIGNGSIIRQNVTFKFVGAEPEGATSLEAWNKHFSNMPSYNPATGSIREYIDAKPQVKFFIFAHAILFSMRPNWYLVLILNSNSCFCCPSPGVHCALLYLSRESRFELNKCSSILCL